MKRKIKLSDSTKVEGDEEGIQHKDRGISIGSANNNTIFDFSLTEGQSRRVLMADCETECSQILPNLFVSGAGVARELDTLLRCNISCIVNCSADIVEDFFVHLPEFRYLSLNMVDGRMDDVSWFLGDVIHFVDNAHKMGKNVLIHCERGVSRSCSFAIAYTMWLKGMNWRDTFNYVKGQRPCCAPNTAFTCNLIEITTYFTQQWRLDHVAVWRIASHLTTHDPHTPVLKLCRVGQSRVLSLPRTSILDPKGVYVIKPSESSYIDGVTVASLFVWKGEYATETVADVAEDLAQNLLGVFTNARVVERIEMGHETEEFWRFVTNDGVYSSEIAMKSEECFDDHFYNSSLLEDSMYANYLATGNETVQMTTG